MSRIVCLASAAVLVWLVAGTADSQPTPLRVCADPDNLPFSNQQLEGFENKIATVIAGELGTTVSYFWWPHQRGLVRNTLRADECDVLVGIPKGYDLVTWTKPYYRSTYVLAYPKAKGYQITSLDAPVLKQIKIGVHNNTPAQDVLAEHGILDNVVIYSLFHDPRNPNEGPLKLLSDLTAGKIDAGVAWGPMAGYFVKKRNAPLEVMPLPSEAKIPLAFDISMGVRKGDQALKDRLEAALDARQADIRKILEDYGVPMLPMATK